MRTFITYASVLSLVAILGALAGWYVFLHSRAQAIRGADSARGFGTVISIPSRNDATGSARSSAVYPPASGFISGIGAIVGVSATNTGTSTTRTSIRPHLSQPTKNPVSGFGFVEQGGVVQLFYVERSTGNVFAVDLDSGAVVRITKTLRPKIYEALFVGATVIERSVSEDGSIETFAGKLDAAVATSTSIALAGHSLEKNILAISGTQSTLFYLRKNADTTEGVTAQADGTKQKIVFSSPLSDWLPSALSDGRLFVAQKAASDVPGFAYGVGKSGVLVPLVPSAPGLIALPRTWTSALLWSSSGIGDTAIFTRANADAAPVRLPINTIADKCAWVPPPVNASAKKPGPLLAYCAVPHSPLASVFLEEWYQGAIHTEDVWFLVDAADGSSRSFYAGSDSQDVHDPQVDPTGRWVAFIDGRDGSLWILHTAQ